MRRRPERSEDILNREYRWPKIGDRLLRRSDDWEQGVEFSGDALSRHVHLWDGYMSAAAGLIEMCTRDGYEHERHFVIYPILFNYRHGLELAMKWTVLMYGGQGVREDHDLWQLWKQCRKIMEEAESEEDEATQAVEQLVKEFHDLDKTGVTFRYGWRSGGGEIKLPDHMIDLRNIRDVMEGVANFFTGLDGQLSGGH